MKLFMKIMELFMQIIEYALLLVLCVFGVLALSGCGNAEHQYSRGLTVYDKSGCVFNVNSGTGDTVFLNFNKLESAEGCKFEGNKK
jgi:hypothetical protein